MKEIYIILSHSGTLLSKMVKLYTRTKYSHVSIALDKNINVMYSFGRLKAYNPFWGGFVQESSSFGTYKRFKNAIACVYALQVTDEQYRQIQINIKYFKEYGALYRFNMLGLISVIFNINLHRDRCFYCAEFVKYLIEKSGTSSNLPCVIKPEDFTKLPNIRVICEGRLRDITNRANKQLDKTEHLICGCNFKKI